MFEMIINVCFSEIDGVGYVGNIVMVVWFEEVCILLFEMFILILVLDSWLLILVSYQVDFYV